MNILTKDLGSLEHTDLDETSNEIKTIYGTTF